VPRSGVARAVEEVLRFLRKGFARFAELSPTQLNLSWVTDDLAVGGAVHTRHIPRLKAMGIQAVVDCREEATDDEVALARNGIDFLRLPTPDAHTLAQADLDRGVSWVKERLARGEKVYVHCSHGVGRGPLLAACFLVSEGYSPVNALQIVRTRRWQASPNEEQVDGLVTYAERRKATAEP
jgi:protein-tyrosine phosphatase